MELKRIVKSSEPEAGKLIALQNATFPEYERYIGTSLLANMIDHQKSLHFNAVYEGGRLAGLFMYWDLPECHYIHFITIYPELRNRKIGQQLLDWVAANLHLPVFLESEVPYDDITARRLAFYKRNGFRELAEDPATLAEDRDGGHPLWFMGTQTIEKLDDYLVQVKEGVYHATGE